MASLSGIVWYTGNLQAFSYQTPQLRGGLQSFRYDTALGPLALQGFSYDFLPTLAVLIEDGNGIVPSGAATTDQTPTVSWTAPGAGGPYTYRWSVSVTNASGAFMASGTVANTNQATLPNLSPGVYYLAIVATTGSGSALPLQPLTFTVLPVPHPVSLAGFDPGLTLDEQLDAFQIEPVIPQDDDYLRYLPQWMSVYGTAAAPPSGALLYRTLRQLVIGPVRALGKAALTYLDESNVLAAPLGLPRKAWHLPTRRQPRDALMVAAQVSGTTLLLRRSFSLFDFYSAGDPCFILGDSGQLLMRNLAQRTVLCSPISGSTGATGAALLSLSSQYQIPFEGAGIVPDADLFFQPSGGIQYRIHAGSPCVDTANALVQLPVGFNLPTTFTYQSKTLAPVITVSLSGSPYLVPGPVDLPNRFDELGVLASLFRRSDEDNLSLRNRIYARYITRRGTTVQAVPQHISQDLDRVVVIGWDGRSVLNLSASGIYGVRQVDVPGLPAWQTYTETLLPYSLQQYTASKGAWKPGWFVTTNGLPATAVRYPNLTLTNNLLDFGAPVSGTVYAVFRADNYTLASTAQGFVSTVTPVAGNVPSGNYQVVLSQNCRVFTPADPAYQQVYLLNADGTPNGFFLDLRQRLLEASPNHFSRARWGESAYWLSQTQDLPPIEHLPLPLDQGVH